MCMLYDVAVQYVTTEMISECDTYAEFRSRLDAVVPDYVPGSTISEVSSECWDEYWSKYR